MSKEFDVEQVTEQITDWIKNWFHTNASMKNAVIGISGGIDSAVVTALCRKALGKYRIIAVLMPNIYQEDYDIAAEVAYKMTDYVYPINIGRAYTDILMQMADFRIQASDQTRYNLPARLRMATLYAIAQSTNGMVANTCNLSESYVGYDTLFGDQCGSFAPIACLTKTEVRAIADYLCIPKKIITKDPSDGLCGRTDEESFGFTYKELDSYLRNGGIGVAANTIAEIERMHKASEYKRRMVQIDSFQLED